MLKAIPHYLCSLPHLSPPEQLPPQHCFPAQLAEAPPKKFLLTKPLWSGLPKLDRQDNRKLQEIIRWITIRCKPVAVPASTNWDLASVESPETLKVRKQKIFSWVLQVQTSALCCENISTIRRCTCLLHRKGKDTQSDKKWAVNKARPHFLVLKIINKLWPDHCAQRDHHCPRDLESHLNKRRVPLPPPVIWDDKDEIWWRRLFSTWFVAREWVGVDQVREEFHLYHLPSSGLNHLESSWQQDSPPSHSSLQLPGQKSPEPVCPCCSLSHLPFSQVVETFDPGMAKKKFRWRCIKDFQSQLSHF